MGKLYFIFGIHSHQPVGNFDFVFDDAYHKAYQPFLDVVSRYPEFKLNIHYSGILWDWIDQHYSVHIRQMNQLVRRGQVELLSGGFYEPIISVIPRYDAVGQIRMLSRWLTEKYRYTPRGMWLAERVWEPNLPSVMAEAGITYSVIDDTHFKYAGLQQDELYDYYATEDAGKLVYLFPISQRLRYTIPFQEPEVTLNYFREVLSDGKDHLLVFADDGEKFGVWPGTYPHVYENRWLERFIEAILANRDWIELLHFSEALEKLPPGGRVYLPTASYAEMMHWALPVKAYHQYERFEHILKDHQLFDEFNVFVRGGFWRNFLSKYPESNNMHKKSLYLSEWAQDILTRDPENALAQQAQDHIWAGQCNCPYWHGVFGGLYLGHIRHAMYTNFLEAEKLLRQADPARNKAQVVTLDFDADGHDEVLLESPNLNAYVAPHRGGHIFEIDFLPRNFNIVNTMTRREEGYHKKLREMAAHQQAQEAGAGEGVASIHDLVMVKEQGLEKYLIYDSYQRKVGIDHWFPADIQLTEFQSGHYREIGDFVEQPYAVVDSRIYQGSPRVQMHREGHLRLQEQPLPVNLTKMYSIQKTNSILVTEYNIEVQGTGEDVLFGVEFNFSLFAGDVPDRYYFSQDAELPERKLRAVGELPPVSHFGLMDEYNGFSIELIPNRPARVWYLPVETVSLSEAGFERVYQNSCVILLFPVRIGHKFDVKIETKVQIT